MLERERQRKRKRKRERWWAQEHQIGAKKLLGWWPFMRPSEASVSTQTGLTLSSGPSVLARISLTLSLFYYLSLSLSLSLSVPLYYAFNWAASLPIIAEESEVVMGAKLETTTAACKFSLVQHSLHYFLSFALKRGRALLLFFFYKQSNYSLNFVNGRWVFFGFLWSIIWDGYSVILSLGSYRFQ